jgi:hypothetical protein
MMIINIFFYFFIALLIIVLIDKIGIVSLVFSLIIIGSFPHSLTPQNQS